MVAVEAHLARLAELTAAAAGVSSPWRVLHEADGLVQVALAIKASPPLYQGIVGTLGDLLVQTFADAGDPLVAQAINTIVDARDDLDAGRIDRAAFELRARLAVEHVSDELARAGRQLPPEVQRGYAQAMAAAYTLGRAEVAKPLGWAIDFELVDQDAVHGLANTGLWWVGDAYGDVLDTPKLLEVVNQVALQQGLGREAAGEALAAAFGGQFKRSALYWRGLAATVATRARSFGALSSFEQHGGTQYEYVNPDDERTSDVCRALNGTTFTVKGALDLRQRLLEAKSPEDWKAISSWPRPRDLEGPDGKLLDPAALQAKGIAWPPLHFHCRSVIEVVVWLPADAMPDHDQAPTPTPPPTPATKPPPPPRARKPRAPKAKGPPVRTWATIKGELASSEATLAGRGLAGDDYGRIGQQARSALFRYRTDLDPTNVHTWPTGYWRAFRMGPYADELRGTAHVRDFMAELVRERARVATIVDAQRLAALDEAIAELRADLAAVGRHQALIREAAAKAPADWRRKARRKLVERFMGKRPSSMKAAEWAAAVDSADEALVAMPDDLLHLLLAEGERYKHNGRNQRAHAMPILQVAGYVEQDARTLITWGRLPDGSMGWLPDRVGRGQITLAHEAGHRLDGVFGARALDGWDTGRRWANHVDAYPEVGTWWDDAWGAPFDRQIARDAAGNKLVVKLAYETNPRNRHRFAGTWVREYEARIYHGGSAAPTAADLAQPHVGGPVEFVSMGTEYVAGAQRRLRTVIEMRTRIVQAGGSVGRPLSQRLVAELADTEIDKARYLYGAGYRDGVARLYRGGERQLQALIEVGSLGPATFANDADVIATAMAVHFHTGADLERLLFAPDALLRPFLSNAAQGQSVVRTMATSLLPAVTDDPATAARTLSSAYDVIKTVLSSSAVTDPPSAAALALPL